MTVGIKASADGTQGILSVGGVDKVTIGANGITPESIAQRLTLGTAQATTSGTSIDFTGIPSWVKQVTVLFNGVSTSGTSGIHIQLGTSIGIESTGYGGSVDFIEDNAAGTTFSTGFLVDKSTGASDARSGRTVFNLVSGNTWIGAGTLSNGVTALFLSAGTKTLGGTLDRLRLATVNGTDTFDAGSVNILYEG